MGDLGKAREILKQFEKTGEAPADELEWAKKFMEEFREAYRKGLEEDAVRQKEIAREWSVCDADGLDDE